MRSLSEIDTVSKRSSRAAGYSWGIAEEIGKNIRLLEIFSLPGIKNLNSFFKKKKELRLENISIIKQDNEASKNEYCPIIAGVNFLDQIKTLETLNNLNKNTLMQTLEIEFVDVGNDYVTAKMPVNFRVHQPYGILHGGATAALAETVGSCASALFIDTKTFWLYNVLLQRR